MNSPTPKWYHSCRDAPTISCAGHLTCIPGASCAERGPGSRADFPQRAKGEGPADLPHLAMVCLLSMEVDGPSTRVPLISVLGCTVPVILSSGLGGLPYARTTSGQMGWRVAFLFFEFRDMPQELTAEHGRGLKTCVPSTTWWLTHLNDRLSSFSLAPTFSGLCLVVLTSPIRSASRLTMHNTDQGGRECNINTGSLMAPLNDRFFSCSPCLCSLPPKAHD